jgi:hypothetical protein
MYRKHWILRRTDEKEIQRWLGAMAQARQVTGEADDS